ncbi:MAG: prevent-host-death protein [Acidimicrobiales bacterium]
MARADPAAPFALTHQFKAREARDHFKALLDRAEGGGVAVLRRNCTMVLVERDVLDSALAALHPFEVSVSFSGGQTSMWIEGVPVHGVGDSYDEAEEDLLDALVDYAEAWVSELRFAPNHKANHGLVDRVLMFAGERDELRRVVFGDE